MATITWKGGVSNNWNDAGNWSTGNVPGAADTALINKNVTVLSSQNNTVTALGLIATATLDVTGATFAIAGATAATALAGTLVVADNAALDLAGTINESGTIDLNSTGDTTRIVLTANTTLQGGGVVDLSASSANVIYGAAGKDVLTNLNTIAGSGNLGDGQLTLVNGAAGTIDANQAAAALYVNTGASFATTNHGLMEATNGGDLILVNTVTNTAATIAATGTGSVVTIEGDIISGTLTSSGGGVLSADGGQLDGLTARAVVLGGTLDLNDNTSLNLAGTISNGGTIALNSSGDNTNLIVNSPTVTLTGGGKVVMSGSTANRIYGSSTAYTLDNVNNTISGQGQLGANGLKIVNAGTVDANATGALTVQSNYLTTNTGLLEATAGGNLVLDGIVTNVGGTILATGAGSTVTLNGADIQGGTLKTASTGAINAVGGAQLDGLAYGQIVNAGTVTVLDNNSLYLQGTIDNTGTIILSASSSDNTNLIANSSTVSLTGGGTVRLIDNPANRVYGANSGVILVNVNNTIVGAGQLGVGQLNFTNDAAGVVNANDVNALNVAVGGDLLSNYGLMEATGTAAGDGGLVLSSTVSNAGTITAKGAHAVVTLNNGMSVSGGLLSTSGGGTIVTSNATLDGVNNGAITVSAALTVADDTNLGLFGTVDNTGTITLASTNDNTNLIAGSLATDTLTGGGTILMTDNAANRIYGAGNGNILVNVNNTIEGAGQLGAGQLVLTNDTAGVIDATGVNALTVSVGAQNITNLGTMEATGTASGSGGLAIDSSVLNVGGTIQAVGTNAVVTLLSGMNVYGGLVQTSHGGAVLIENAGLDGNDDGPITLNAAATVADDTSVYLYGTVENLGTLTLAGTGDNTNLIVQSSTVTLTGGGSIVLSDNPANRIYVNGTAVLVNVNETISGAGQLGADTSLSFTNEAAGLIDANGSNALVFNTASQIASNQGTIESTSAGSLQLQSAITNAGGVIQAVGAGVITFNGGTVQGGLLQSLSGGTIAVIGSGSLDGATAGAITLAGTLTVDDNTNLYIAGTIDNIGTIAVASTSDNTNIQLTTQTVTLTGGGVIAMSNSSANRIYANSSASQTLVNLNNTIEGAGQLGDGSMQLTNSGVILANASGGLVVNTGGGNLQNLASGLMEASGTGDALTVSSGIFSNLGTLEAAGGGALTLQSGVSFTNVVNGTLTGGTYEAIGKTSTLSLDGGNVTSLAATVVLQGLGSVLQTGNGSTFSALESTLTTVASTGTLSVLNSRNYITGKKLTNNGSVNLGGGNLKAKGLTVGTTGAVVGFGTITDAPVNNGTIEALGGSLDITGIASGTGTLEVGAASTLALSVGASQGVVFLSNTGTLLLDQPAGFNNESIGGLQVGDTIDLANTGVSSAVVSNGNTLVVTTTTGPVYDYLVSGAIAGNHFTPVSDGNGGTNLVLTAGADAIAHLATQGQAMMAAEFTWPGAAATPQPAGGGTGSAQPPEPSLLLPAVHGHF